jgi:hypothetical protein
MRDRRADLRIEWLTPEGPAQALPIDRGVVIHPASAELPSQPPHAANFLDPDALLRDPDGNLVGIVAIVS